MRSWRPSLRWRSEPPPRRRGQLLASILGGVILEAAATWLRSRRLGGNLVVRCRQGHLFTTLWIPAASVKSLRFGWWRFQYCPVGHHWSVVIPVREDGLNEDERRLARAQHDIPLP